MRNNTLICDKCGDKDDATAESFSVAIKRYTDAAGSSDTRTQDFDLCSKCKGQFIKYIVNLYVDFMTNGGL